MNREYDPITGFPLWLPAHLRYKRWITASDLPEPEKGHCAWCGEKITAKGQRRYCGYKCRHEFEIRSEHRVLYPTIKRRDGGWKCSQCGETGDDHGYERYIHIDHIVPVIEGGGCCGLVNYRQLCRKCHGVESGALRRRLNHARRCAKGLPEQQVLPI